MNKHKKKCDLLKKIRKGVADKIGIDLHQVECKFEGDCPGTCPKCKQEEDILNKALAKRAGALAAGATASLMLTACIPTSIGVNNPSTGNPYPSIVTPEEVSTEDANSIDEPLAGDIVYAKPTKTKNTKSEVSRSEEIKEDTEIEELDTLKCGLEIDESSLNAEGGDELFEELAGDIAIEDPIIEEADNWDNLENTDELDFESDLSNYTPIVTAGVLPYYGPDIEELQVKYPEYFEIGTFKGLEVYVWQMSENDYRFGLMQGTNRNKTLEEKLALKGATAEEMSLILSTFDIEDKDIFVIPWQNPISSYMVTKDMIKDTEYINNIRSMLGINAEVME